MDLKALSEFGLIDRIRKQARSRSPRVRAGIGDDCAVILNAGGELKLITTDLLIQDVHFRLNFCHPVSLGKKALAISVSDIAAMGGQPEFYLALLACPASTDVSLLDSLYAGMEAVAEDYDITLVGGDTSKAPIILVGTLLMGRAKEDKVVYRCGAKQGDRIYVTGTLGDAAFGLELLSKAMAGASGPVCWKEIKERVVSIYSPAALDLVNRQLAPTPRLKEGHDLAGGGIPSAMIDISDGLLADLNHICEESKVGARIDLSALPSSDPFRALAAALPDGGSSFMLAGGEEYELLFTVPEEREALLQGLGSAGEFHKIGEITDQVGRVRVLDQSGEEVKFAKMGYDHFGGKG